jgi:TonB family protein
VRPSRRDRHLAAARRIVRYLAVILTLSALTPPVAARPAAPVQPAPPSRWGFFDTRNYCYVSQRPLPGKADFAFDLNVPGRVELLVQGLDWTVEDREPILLDFQAGAIRRERVRATGYRPTYARKGFRAMLDSAFLAEVARTGLLAVYRDGRQVALLDPEGMQAALGRGRACQARLEARYGPMPFVYAPPAPPPPPPPPPAPPRKGPAEAAMRDGFMDNADYPASSLRANEQGEVRFEAEIGTDGSVTRCTVTRSSGSNELDYQTCRLFRQRFSFWPALDSAGKPIVSTIQRRIIWRIPEDQPVPPPPAATPPAPDG